MVTGGLLPSGSCIQELYQCAVDGIDVEEDIQPGERGNKIWRQIINEEWLEICETGLCLGVDMNNMIMMALEKKRKHLMFCIEVWPFLRRF